MVHSVEIHEIPVQFFYLSLQNLLGTLDTIFNGLKHLNDFKT